MNVGPTRYRSLGTPIAGSASLVPGEYDPAFPGRTSAWVDLYVKGIPCGQSFLEEPTA